MRKEDEEEKINGLIDDFSSFRIRKTCKECFSTEHKFKFCPLFVDFKNNVSNSNNDFRSIHSMTPNEIKNEKIDILYKFRKLEGQGIRTTMNYNMNSNLEDMRSEYYKLKKQSNKHVYFVRKTIN